MKDMIYTNGGVKYHFEERDGILYLLSLEIWDKVFEFPNGGIAERDSVGSLQIQDHSVGKVDLDQEVNDTLDAVQEASTIGMDAVGDMVANAIAAATGGGGGGTQEAGSDTGADDGNLDI